MERVACDASASAKVMDIWLARRHVGEPAVNFPATRMDVTVRFSGASSMTS
jgi:hypothetical protein